jgi:hypothetical protein
MEEVRREELRGDVLTTAHLHLVDIAPDDGLVGIDWG